MPDRRELLLRKLGKVNLPDAPKSFEQTYAEGRERREQAWIDEDDEPVSPDQEPRVTRRRVSS